MNSERIEAILQAVRGNEILNLGCVNHSIALTDDEKERWLQLKLSERFPSANVLGLDIDEENVVRMQAQGMNVEVGDAQQLNYRKKFDTIILGEIIEHLENPGACLEGCRRAVKPGGRIILSTPNIFCVMHMLMYFKNYDHAFNGEHVAWFCPQTLRTMVERCGLRIESFKFVDDLAPDVVPDLPYRLFAYAWLGVRWIFPQRYRNTMVAVCVSSEEREVVSAAARGRSEVSSHV
ncbi:MAG TPA: methyltransferase domain-containing protein [Candidatus Acidoferrum sp.]|nr:methyltransferase domain-containing protein [Candidatus Acidoferrum sp.]